MSFPPYPKYKASGVEWLGNVPDHWSVKPLYSAVVERAESNKGMIEDNLLSLSYGRIVSKDISSNDGLLPGSFETYQIVRPGDIVLRLTDLQNDKRSLRSAIVDEKGIITSAYLAVTPRGPDSKYMSYLFRAYDVTKVFYSMGGGLRQSMNFSDLKRMPMLLPPPTEQMRIVSFLDKETAKIDGLVEEQQRLMALLNEKRRAFISHAVTKGLNPRIPMKQSGIEWLGDVPAHWDLIPIKYVVTLRSGGTPSKANPAYWDGTVPWASSKDIKQEELSDTEDHITQRALDDAASELVPAGSLLVVVRGMILIHTFPVAKTLVPMSINQDLRALTPNRKLSVDFLAWLLRGTSRETLGRVDRAAHGTTVLRTEDWTSMVLPIPPLDEQSEIVVGVAERLRALDSLISEAERAIDLLQERRIALISAAVTGQIDIRPVVGKVPA